MQTALAAHDALRARPASRRGCSTCTRSSRSTAPSIERAARETGRLVTVEEHFIDGGLGGAVAEILAELGSGRLRRVGVRDRFCTEVAPYAELLRIHGIDAAGVVAAVRELL